LCCLLLDFARLFSSIAPESGAVDLSQDANLGRRQSFLGSCLGREQAAVKN
jgi:hypothetical protein